MGVKLEKGAIISTEGSKHGEGQKGKYLFIPVNAEKGYKRINVWATNADDPNLAYAKSVKIESIDSILFTAEQDKNNPGRWYDKVNANCTLSVADSAPKSNGDDFLDMPASIETEANRLFGIDF